MMNTNKILTVSYGTFSCTLEGFDDSFGTMKAIAEYFRDLSADDRYFGSEPIQPDAQMLARIAEREISRQVDAREDQGRIVLSAQSGPRAAALVAADTLDDVADAVAEATVAKAQEAAAETSDAPETAPPVTDDPANTGAADETSAPDALADSLSIPPSVTPQVDEAGIDETPPAPADDIVPSLPDDDVEAFFADTSQPKTAAMFDAEDADNAPAADRAKADSIADKLKRIRAVVSQQAEAPQVHDYSEDQHAEATTVQAADETADEHDADTTSADAEGTTVEEANPDVLADTLRDLEDALDADDEVEVTVSGIDDESEDDDIAAILSRLDSEAATPANGDAAVSAEREIPQAPTADHDTDADSEENSEENILAAMDTLGAAGEPGDLEKENLFEEEARTAAPDVTPPPLPKEVAPLSAAPRTRVLKVKRATLEAAIQAGQLEEYDDEKEETPAVAKTAPPRKAPLADRSSLTDEAEADLARELAELEAEMKAEDEAAAARRKEQIAREATLRAEALKAEARRQAAREEDASDASFADGDAFDDEPDETDGAFDDQDHDTSYLQDEETEEQKAPTTRAEISGAADKDFSRLMDESDHQMEEPEAATRRDAFAHLRAAVAAKKADEAAGGSSDVEETDEAYRDDLADVVRPRRPVSGGDRPRTERPADPRPAPLKLVAEQRIDVDQPRNVTPVRPRRVSAVTSVPSPASTSPDASSFTEFATKMGATKLPDLLEAAAAYLSFVEGHEEFSRPQLMTKVRQVEKENFTREDSLRSFGKLLREGKIEKLKGGRFQASEQIGFKPDTRAAG